VPCATPAPDFKGQTLILPSVAVGNVAQLCVDAFLTTLAADADSAPVTKVGYLHDENVACAAANDALAPTPAHFDGAITLSVEVFQCPRRKLVIVQHRAPILKSRRVNYARNICKWARECGFQRIVNLSSCQAHVRGDRMLAGPPFQYFVTAAAEEEAAMHAATARLGFKQMADEGSGPGPLSPLAMPARGPLAMGDLRAALPELGPGAGIRGGGITRALWHQVHGLNNPSSADAAASGTAEPSAPEHKQAAGGAVLNLLGLVAYASEGDNSHEGVVMAMALNMLLGTLLGDADPSKKVKWAVPHSWSHVYGRPPDEQLYL